MTEIVAELMNVTVIVHHVIKILVYLNQNHLIIVQKIENHHLVPHRVHLLRPVLDHIPLLPLLHLHLHHPVHHQVVHLDLHLNVKNVFELLQHAHVYQHHLIQMMKISLFLYELLNHMNNPNANRLKLN